ncbi:MAG TPA: EF-P beta-lysylation protein EpmB [Pseudomonadales bacterium]|nr:EF-P beta-lysylation protein EpmB [Pseudomonadales bacterium]
MKKTPIIPNIAPIWQSQSWQNLLANAYDNSADLLAALALDERDIDSSIKAAQDFPLRVPASYVAKMQKGDPNDPLLRQVLPLGAELDAITGFSNDPLDERERNPLPGIVHKYHGRVLLITSGACAINCRYCFRRHFPYQENNPSLNEWQQSLDYIAARPEIDEVILSGGDPLAASDKYLTKLVAHIAAIPHVRRLRIHSRLPIVIPQRITQETLSWMDVERFDIAFVVHANHPNELDSLTAAAFSMLRQHGITLLNQGVLLAGINDNVDTQVALSKGLFSQGVLPYYMHALDKVTGAAHFDVSHVQAQLLASALLEALPGYLVPKFVYTQPGAKHKILL